MPDEQVVILDPPPSPQTAVSLTFDARFQLLINDLKFILNLIERYLRTQKDEFYSKLIVLTADLKQGTSHIKKYLFPRSKSLDTLLSTNTLENEFESLASSLEFFTFSKFKLVEIFDLKDSGSFLSIANSVFNELKFILETVDEISKYRIFHFPPADNANKSIFEEYKLVGGCIHSRNDHVLSNIQEYIDKISLPLYTFTSSGVSTFLAFVGPSLTGKSQSAFTLAYGQPVLYFNFKPASQPIYKPFLNLFSDMDKRLSQDLDKFRTELEGYKFPGAEFLFTKLSNVPFKSLGLLWALTEAGLNYEFEDPNKYWFDDYLNLNLLMEDELSINDFKSKFSK